jgi:hypothetical protein
MKYDALDVTRLVESAFYAFCEQHGITGRTEKQKALADIAAAAKDLRKRM